MKPKVSIIMGAYNEAGRLDRTVGSILSQTFNNFEFIVIDDGSTDSTYDELIEYAKKDKRIIIIKNKKNIGLVKSLNKGIVISKGEYIARIDAGDWWDKTKLEKQVGFLENHKDYIICGTRTVFTDEEGNFLEQRKEKDNSKKNKVGSFVHPSIVFRNRKIYYREFFEYSQDLDLYLRLSLLGKFYRLSEPLTFCFVNLTSSLSINKRYYARQERKIIYNLFKERKKFGRDSFDQGKTPVIKESRIGLKLCGLSNLFWGRYVKYRISKKNYFLGTIYLLLSLVFYPPILVDYIKDRGKKISKSV